MISQEIKIHRLFGLSPSDQLIAPDWDLRKSDFLNTIDNYLEKTDSFQGKHYKSNLIC